MLLSAFLPSPAADSAGVLDTYHILRELSARHQVTLLSFASEEDREHIPSLLRICSDVTSIHAPALPGTTRYRLYTAWSFLSPLPAIACMSHSKQMVKMLREKIAKSKFDLVHVEFTQMAHYLEYLAGTPAIIDESDIAFIRRKRFAEHIHFSARRKLLEWDTEKLEHYEVHYCRGYDGVLVRTESDKQLLQRFMPRQRIEVFPPWVDLSFADAVLETPAGNDILFYGAMWRPVNEQAAFYFAKEIFPRILPSHPQVKFVIMGSRPSARLSRLRSENVLVTGYVAALAPMYSRASVVVAPLLSGSGIKGKVIQALGCGKPVVTTSVGAEGIPAGEQDGLFIRDDAEQFADCVRWLLQENRYLAYREPARRFVLHFYNWNAGVDRLERFYQAVIAEKAKQRRRSL